MSPSPTPHPASADAPASSPPAVHEPSLAHTQALQGLLAELVGANGQGVAIKSLASGHYEYASESFARLFGRQVHEIVGRADDGFLPPGKATVLRAADMAADGLGASERAEHRLEIGGVPRDFVVWRLALPSAEGDATAHRQLSLWTEATYSRRSEEALQAALAQLEAAHGVERELRAQLRDEALRDVTSGLYRQGRFVEQLRREIDLSSREHREFSLVSISVDPPSALLQAAGEAGRVRVFEALDHLLQRNTRAMDMSSRLDDEHFAVLLSGVGLATAHARMDGLRRSCATHMVVLDGKQYGFTISMGIASYPHTASDEAELVFAAHKALAQARMRGNHVSLASISLG